VESYLEDPLAESILRGDIKDGEPVAVDRKGDKLFFKQKTPPATSDVKL
jgi:ATP-dependent Clp protease ATP-binding subunit ClpC